MRCTTRGEVQFFEVVDHSSPPRDRRRSAMDVIYEAISYRLALRIQIEPTPADESARGAIALIENLEGCADLQREECTTDGIFTASSVFWR